MEGVWKSKLERAVGMWDGDLPCSAGKWCIHNESVDKGG